MKVLIVNNMAPFIWGGAEELATHLQKNIQLAGHEAEIMRIPFQWKPTIKIPSQMLMYRNFELFNVDKVIALKFPAYLIRHPNKVIWLLHQYRQAYDLCDNQQINFEGSLENEIEQAIHAGDNEAFLEAKKIFTISEIVQNRLKHYNNLNSEVLLFPVNDGELFQEKKLGQYIFAGGRINSMKRQHLLIEALALTPNHVQLVIAGPPDDAEYAIKLHALANKLGVEDRLKLDFRFLPRAELAEYVNNALACAYLPFNEDALAYVTMEAAHAGKALITTLDSGGVLGLAKHNVTGWVVESNSKELANAMTDAATNKAATQSKGKAARELWHSFNITWENTVQRLLS